MVRLIFALSLALAGTALLAADAAEISFWESVRDSRNPAELRAYLQQYPNGTFKALAETRLATLEKAPAALPPRPRSAPTPVVAGAPHKLQTGDAWTYRLSYPRLRGQWGQPTRPPVTHAITLSSTDGGRAVDELSVDGGTLRSITHGSNPTLLVQGASIFSPYLLSLGSPPAPGRLRTIAINEPGCARTYACEAKAQILGQETVRVPAGQFLATRVVVDQEWRPQSGFGANLMGSRTLTVWYAPEIGRAVKYSSRLVIGNIPPMDANFDLELVSYQLK